MTAMPHEVYLPAGGLTRAWRAHWPLGAILVVAAFLLFTGLNRDSLWADEGDTAVLAQNILSSGVPSAWDGRTFTDSDYGARVNDDLVMVSHPWLQYYVAATSFAVFGRSAGAARLPFALFGLLTIGLVYALVLATARERLPAAAAALLLMLSVQFLIYARQSRYYTLTAALTCLLVWQFLRLSSWRQTLLFSLTAVLLFHSHPIALAPLGAMGALTLVHRGFTNQRAWFWKAALIVAPLTLPWFALAGGALQYNTGMIERLAQFLPRFGQFAVEAASVTPLLGLAVLALVARRRRARAVPVAPGRRKTARTAPPPAPALDDTQRLCTVLWAVLLAYAVAIAVTQSRDAIFTVGLRYTTAVIPFVAIMTAVAIFRIARRNWRIWAALLLVLGFTKLGRITPYIFWQDPSVRRDPDENVTFHNTETLTDRVFRTGQIAFVRSLFESNPGTTALVAEFLRANAAPNDVVVTNYGWEALYFHTGLPQGWTILPSYPIYATARAKGLPDYVFDPTRARWIVWRRAWGAYRGQAIEKAVADLRAAGARVTQVAAIPETVWENRENVHFRRFPGDWYPYSWFESLPETLVYRVDRPDTTGGGGRPLP
jgi:4-amino-4-deoxy-L-arabinose transferase-like glycosyltransferase